MPTKRRDDLRRLLTASPSRRDIARAVASLVGLGPLVAVLGGASKVKKKPCQKHCGRCRKCRNGRCQRTKRCKSQAEICAGRCGVVRYRCPCWKMKIKFKTYDCGACVCDPPCGACERCQADGSCAAACGGTGCCDNGTCGPGTSDSACGTGGDACVACPEGEVCSGGDCV